MATTPFRVLLRMELVPGGGPDFERAWRDGAATITGQPANLAQSLASSAEEPDVYYIISDWTDEPAFREYELGEAHLAHRATLHPYRKAGSMVTMTVVEAMTGLAAVAVP